MKISIDATNAVRPYEMAKDHLINQIVEQFVKGLAQQFQMTLTGRERMHENIVLAIERETS